MTSGYIPEAPADRFAPSAFAEEKMIENLKKNDQYIEDDLSKMPDGQKWLRYLEAFLKPGEKYKPGLMRVKRQAVLRARKFFDNLTRHRHVAKKRIAELKARSTAASTQGSVIAVDMSEKKTQRTEGSVQQSKIASTTAFTMKDVYKYQAWQKRHVLWYELIEIDYPGFKNLAPPTSDLKKTQKTWMTEADIHWETLEWWQKVSLCMKHYVKAPSQEYEQFQKLQDDKNCKIKIITDNITELVKLETHSPYNNKKPLVLQKCGRTKDGLPTLVDEFFIGIIKERKNVEDLCEESMLRAIAKNMPVDDVRKLLLHSFGSPTDIKTAHLLARDFYTSMANMRRRFVYVLHNYKDQILIYNIADEMARTLLISREVIFGQPLNFDEYLQYTYTRHSQLDSIDMPSSVGAVTKAFIRAGTNASKASIDTKKGHPVNDGNIIHLSDSEFNHLLITYPEHWLSMAATSCLFKVDKWSTEDQHMDTSLNAFDFEPPRHAYIFENDDLDDLTEFEHDDASFVSTPAKKLDHLNGNSGFYYNGQKRMYGYVKTNPLDAFQKFINIEPRALCDGRRRLPLIARYLSLLAILIIAIMWLLVAVYSEPIQI